MRSFAQSRRRSSPFSSSGSRSSEHGSADHADRRPRTLTVYNVCRWNCSTRKLIVSNRITLDGYYQGPDRSVDSLFAYFHEAYAGDQAFDQYNAERLRAADFLVLSRSTFLSNKSFWPDVATDPDATPIRRETAGLFSASEKLVIADNLTEGELVPWTNTQVFRRADAYQELAALKQQPGRDILVSMSCLL